MGERYASKTDYLRTKRSCECDIHRDYKSCVNIIRNKCKTKINVHPLKIGHSEKEVYHGTILPGRFPKSELLSDIDPIYEDKIRYQFLHRDTSRSDAIRRRRLQVLKLNESSSNINQSVLCNDIDFESFPCQKNIFET